MKIMIKKELKIDLNFAVYEHKFMVDFALSDSSVGQFSFSFLSNNSERVIDENWRFLEYNYRHDKVIALKQLVQSEDFNKSSFKLVESSGSGWNTNDHAIPCWGEIWVNASDRQGIIRYIGNGKATPGSSEVNSYLYYNTWSSDHSRLTRSVLVIDDKTGYEPFLRIGIVEKVQEIASDSSQGNQKK